MKGSQLAPDGLLWLSGVTSFCVFSAEVAISQ